MTLPYNLKECYLITPNTEAADFIEYQVQQFFNYQPKSKRSKYADVWLNECEGLNVKTDNLLSQQNKGRLCTAAINQWLLNPNHQLKFLFVEYKNESGKLTIVSTKEVYIEEVEYEISNQGKGLLQPKRTSNGKVIFRERISREEWIKEFKMKYSEFVDRQIKRFEQYKRDWCS